MDSSKRRRVEQHDDATDRLGDLPDCLLHDILSRLGSRQTVQTSLLSRRWRHLWRDVLRGNVIVNESEFAGEQWERFEDFADHVLPASIPTETRHLDGFGLNLVSQRVTYSCSDRWIRRGLRRCPAAVDIRTTRYVTVSWQPHRSCLDGSRPQPDVSAAGLCAAGFTRRLTKLHLVGVGMSATFLEDLGTYCPVLEDLHIENFRMMDNLVCIASPTLRNLALVQLRHHLACANLRITAPLLIRLRLELTYDGLNWHCVAAGLATGTEQLALVREALIRLTDTSHHLQRNERRRKKGKLEFLTSMRAFLALLPNAVKLHLAGFTTTALLEEESQEFPVLHRLKTLILEDCDLGVEFQALPGIFQNTSDLEKLGLHHCTFLDPPVKKRRKRGQRPTKNCTLKPYIFWCEKLKSIEIRRRQEDEPLLAKVLLEISEKMHASQWQRVKTSSTSV